MLLLNGPPDGRLEFRCTNVTYPMEVWFYDGSERVAYEFYLIFVQKDGQRRFWLWRPRDGLAGSGRHLDGGPDPVLGRSRAVPGRRLGGAHHPRPAQRPDGVRPARGAAARAHQVAVAASGSPPSRRTRPTCPREPASSRPSSSSPSPAATRAAPRCSAPFASRPATPAGPSSKAQSTFNFLLTGEVLNEGKLFENFRYKFDLPAEGVGDTIPMTFQRRLRPGQVQAGGPRRGPRHQEVLPRRPRHRGAGAGSARARPAGRRRERRASSTPPPRCSRPGRPRSSW